MNKKILITLLMMSFLMIGSVSASLIVYPVCPEYTNSGKETFELGYDCYNQPDTPYSDCKQVEHKRSWFEKKDFHKWMGIGCWDGTDWIYRYIWRRPAKL